MTKLLVTSSDKPTPVEVERVLGTRGWLVDRSDAVRATLLGAGRLVSFGPGETIYNEGDEPDGLYGLVSGVVQIVIPGENGEAITVHRAEPGFWIGDLALFSDQPRLVGVSARGTVWALFVPGARLRELVRLHPDMVRDFYALTHENMRVALRLIANLSIAQSHHRIALRLMHLSDDAQDPEGWMNLSQEELATLTAVSVPTLQRCLRRLSDEGCVEIGYGRLRISDRDALTRFVES